MIVGLFTGLLSEGGIQRFSRHAAAVLTSFAKEQGCPLRILSLNDAQGTHEVIVEGTPVTLHGFGRRKLQFGLSLLNSAPRTSLAYISHPNLAPLGLILKSIKPWAQYIVTAYGIDVWGPLSFIQRMGLRRARAVTAISRYTRQKLVDVHKLTPDRLHLLPPALDSLFLSVGSRDAGPRTAVPSGNLLLTVARLAASEQYKGIEPVFRALKTVLEVIPDTCYLIVGDGDDRPRLESLARQLGLQSHVMFCGRVPDDEILRYFQSCDIYVMPSRGEGFGIVFLEAMACGKPVIGGKHAGTLDIISQGVTGYLVEYDDIKELAERIKTLLQDRNLRTHMGQSGRAMVEKTYSFERFASGFREILAGARSRSW